MVIDEIALFYPLISAATFATSSVMIKQMDKLGTATFLNLWRAAIGGIIFILHLIVVRRVEDIFNLGFWLTVFLILSVLFNVVIGDTLFFRSQSMIGVKIATPIVNTYPLLTVLIGILFLEETVSIQFFEGGILIIFGIIILSSNLNDEDETSIGERSDRKSRKLALSFAILTIFAYALGVTFITLGSEDVNPVVANSIRLPVATILLGGLYKLTHKTGQTSEIKKTEKISKHLPFVIMAGVLGTYISSIFLVLSVQNLGSGKTSVLTATTPLFALPLSIFWVKEKVNKMILLGTLLSVLGVVIIFLE